MLQPLAVAVLAKSVWRDFRRAWGALVVFEFLFKLAEAWLLTPMIALALAALLSRAGHIAVSNRDVLDFLQSPGGVSYAALLVIGAAALLLFEQAGLMGLAQAHLAWRFPTKQWLRVLLKAVRIVELGAIQAVLLALALAPFAVLALIAYRALLSQHDIYFYWKTRPPEFWRAVSVGVVLGLGTAAAAAWLYIRWCLALPILLFEGQGPRAALQTSAQRVRPAAWRIALVLLGWHAAALAAGAALMAGFRALAALLLATAGERPTTTIAILLAVQGGLLAATSFVAAVGRALLTRRIYLQRCEQRGVLRSGKIERSNAVDDAITEQSTSLWPRRLAYLCLALALVSPVVVWTSVIGSLPEHAAVKITAHRGHARRAPENTLSAIRKAIESRADFAEIDAQQSADGVIVVLHDSDLQRVAGDPRRLAELTFDELRRLDVGSWFAPEFAGERLPTLDEVIDTARGRIKLNIELKYYGPDQGLAAAVAHKLAERQFEDQCLITSFDGSALQIAQRQNPKLRTGLIVAHALGDVSRLDVPVLSVRADWLSDAVLRDAQRREREVHVWTVNDPRQMAQWIKRGVDNIITSDPDAAIRVRSQWSDLTPPERLVLASRLLLGLEPD